MKSIRIILAILISALILSGFSYSQTEILKISPAELYYRLKKYLGRQKDKEWAKYNGKIIRWTGNPRPFGTRGITDQGFLLDLSAKADMGYIWIRAYFPQQEEEKLFELSQYDSLVFEGKLTKYSFSSSPGGYHFLIKDARLIKLIFARSIVSIVDYKFNVGPSSLSGDYEFMEFDVILRNDGEQPLKGAILSVTFSDMAVTRRNVFVGPEEVKEIRIWVTDEWIIKGQRKRLPFQIPHGFYEGIIHLRDENGRPIASKSFHSNLQPIERRRLD